MTSLKVAKNLSIPASAITETFAILAARGAGKSNTAAVMAEEMFKAKLPFVVIDPVRAWWGLRSSADGKGPGLPIPIFGGKRGDVPLERGGGQLIADLIVDQRLSCVLDISDFESEAAKKQFLLDFARRLYQRNEAPLHLFLEESDDYIPQKPMKDELQLLRAWENIVRRGRSRGLGMTMITQRSAVLNKNVLTQAQTLIAMRTTGPQDIAAIEAWLKYHQQGKEILESLPSLEDGEAWVWSPRFLKKTVRVRFRMRETFDSGATPKMSKEAKKPATLADIDLKTVKQKMEATIERAKAEDPRQLRAKIAELERQTKAGPVPAAGKLEIKEVPVITDKQFAQLEKTANKVAAVLKRAIESSATIQEAVKSLEAISREISTTARMKSIIKNESSLVRQGFHVPGARAASAKLILTPTLSPRSSRGQALKERGNSVDSLPSGARKILIALAQYPDGRTKVQVAILTGYAHGGGGFINYLGSLRSKGYITGGNDRLRITEAGVVALGGFTPLPTGAELLEHWRRKLGKAERAALDVLISVYPESLPSETVAERAGYAPGTGGINNAFSRLRTLELIHGYSALKASDTLFDWGGK